MSKPLDITQERRAFLLSAPDCRTTHGAVTVRAVGDSFVISAPGHEPHKLAIVGTDAARLNAHWHGYIEAVTARQIEAIARAFAAGLREACAELDSENPNDPPLLSVINAENAKPENAAYCASQTYFDSNMGMACAFEKVTGREPESASQEDADLWNAAWNMASKAGFWINEA